jgi:3-methyladenine DNA glycosylase AlkD
MRSNLLATLRRELAAAADPGRAPLMQAYMKSAMPYHGVSSPRRRFVCRTVFAGVDFPSAEAWRRAVLSIWRRASHREERYAAIELTEIRRFTPFQTIGALPMYEEMIVTGAWWDYVDAIATHRLGFLLRRYPAAMRRKMLTWSRSKDMWKRRSAILCQIQFKKDTDLDLLYACIEPSLPSREFFLRKAIGWALRQYAWTDPREVRRYVAAHQNALSNLSRREALKNVHKELRTQ